MVQFMRYPNLGKYDRNRRVTADNITRRRALRAGLITLQIHRHLEYIILMLFSMQKCLRERTSLLRDSTLLYFG